MKTKLRALFCVGIVVLLAPLLYVPTTLKIVGSIVIGLFIMYLTWRIRTHYKLTLLKLRRYEESPLVQ